MVREDYIVMFSKNLAQKLVEKVRGKVFVNVTPEDELYVSINFNNDIKFKTTLGRFSERVVNGWSTDYACYEIQEQYEKFILRHFLK
jgi:hypothetical protein